MKTYKRSKPMTTELADASPVAEAPTREEIAARAYENFESEGSHHGSDLEHWLAAESRLFAERSF